MAVYGTPNQRAFLDALAAGESTSGSDMNYGYNMGFGRQPITSNKWHPYRKGQFQTTMHSDMFGSTPSPTSAAGRYQFQRGTWEEGARATGVKDFSPESQDKVALWLLYNKRKLGKYVDSGDLKGAFATKAMKDEWASARGILAKLNSGKLKLGVETPAVSAGGDYAAEVMGSPFGTAAAPATPYVPVMLQNDAIDTLQSGIIKPTESAQYKPPEVRPTATTRFFEPDYKSLNAAVKQWSTF